MYHGEQGHPMYVVEECAKSLPDANLYQHGQYCRILLPVKPMVLEPSETVMYMESPPYITFERNRSYCWRQKKWLYYWRPKYRPLD